MSGATSADRVEWSRRPSLDRPVLVTAFAGWNDAGDAASWALRQLHERLLAEPFAEIDAEDFYDFSDTRPIVELDDNQRILRWPTNAFSHVDRDLVLLQGVEPQLRWRTFAEQIVAVAQEIDAAMVVSLGALLSEVPHSRPVMVYGSCQDDALGERLQLERSTYEGPTGIVGVITNMVQRAGIPTASLWAAVPNYVSGAASPKAALALVGRVQEMIDRSVPVTDLEIATAAYERQINEVVSADEDLVAYIEGLEQAFDDGELTDPDPDELIEDIEQFLRDQD